MPLDGTDQRQHRPRHHQAWQRGGRGGADRDRERWPQDEYDSREEARGIAADMQRPGELEQSREPDGHQERQPEAFDQPNWNMQYLTDKKERRHRDRVPDVLILQAALP